MYRERGKERKRGKEEGGMAGGHDGQRLKISESGKGHTRALCITLPTLKF